MILITATGRDRPGMVAAISQKLLAANCNIEDATMTRLSGEFTMILVVANPQELSTPDLQTRLSSLCQSHGLHFSCTDLDEENAVDAQQTSTPEIANTKRYMLSAYGPDRTGLVARVAGVLAAHRANITDLQTRVASGHSLYVMIFELELPLDLDVEILRAALEKAAHELNVELTLCALEEDAL